jgi:hypothetical protein
MSFLNAELVLGVAGVALLALSRPEGGDEAKSVIIATAGATMLLLAIFRTLCGVRKNSSSSSSSSEKNLSDTASPKTAAAAADPAAVAIAAGGGSKLKDIEDLAAPRDNLHTDAAAETRRLKREKLRKKKSLIPLTLAQMAEKSIVRCVAFFLTFRGGAASAAGLCNRVFGRSPTVLGSVTRGGGCGRRCRHRCRRLIPCSRSSSWMLLVFVLALSVAVVVVMVDGGDTGWCGYCCRCGGGGCRCRASFHAEIRCLIRRRTASESWLS